MRCLLLATILGMAVIPLGAAQRPSPKVDELIRKATAYAHEFVTRFSSVVAEERYEQQITEPTRKRVLVSDFLLVKPAGEELRRSFREVAEVDGKPVRNRDERLAELFFEPSSHAILRAAEIRDASARYNLIDVGTLSNPLLVIAFLQEQYVDRFRFNLAGLDTTLGPNVRTVRFEEFRQPTTLRQNANEDLFSRGLVWIEETTGRVVKTELQVHGHPAPTRITTHFRFDEDLGIHVPAAMEDWYSFGCCGFGEFKGKATYGRFRRFQTATQATIQP